MVKLASAEMAEKKLATRAAFGATLAELAEEGVPVVAVDADLTGSTTTKKFAAAAPENADKLFNCGIAEQNMIDVAAGLALTGHVAYTGSFAVFGTGRAYDQIRNTVCYGKLNVKVCPTHAGLSVGPDGGSHQMVEDIALMRVLPNMRVLVPADYAAARAAIKLAAKTPGPVYVRMGRAAVPCVYDDDVELEIGRAYVLREGSDATVVACGVEIREALAAAGGCFDRGHRRVFGEAARRGYHHGKRCEDGLLRGRRGAQRAWRPRFRCGGVPRPQEPRSLRVRGCAGPLRQVRRVRGAARLFQPRCRGDRRSREACPGPQVALRVAVPSRCRLHFMKEGRISSGRCALVVFAQA